jgi:hypothetical protein
MIYGILRNKNEILQRIAAMMLIIFAALAFLFLATGCAKPLYVPGATLGYYIWEDDDGSIHIAWTADRKDTSFDGNIATDGQIIDFGLIGFEEEDNIEIAGDKSGLTFDATLSLDDYSDEIVMDLEDYDYIEFELKINDAYDLSRTNLGRFLNNPPDGVFKISNDYFDEVKEIPFYQRPPFSGFLEKLNADIGFTVFWLFLMGVVAIELIRITVLRKRKKNNWYLFLCYGVLIIIIAVVYLILRVVV